MRKVVSIVVLVVFIITSVQSPAYAQAASSGSMPRLPLPGVMVHLSPEFTPAHLQGIMIHPDNALQFDFLIHRGDQVLEGDQRQEEYKKLVKYFLASLTIPDEDQWVNLSPYEKDRIIQDDFGKTEMGRDLLAQDYMLKQITSSLIYPEDGLGKKFWDRVYARAWSEYHTTNIPVNTFNKVWIVPDQAVVYESGNSAYILKSHLKVMLEEDYLSMQKHIDVGETRGQAPDINKLGFQVIRAIILPELEKEVNTGQNFANLRQMYSGMILATWYKKALKESLLGKIYADKSKVQGVTGIMSADPSVVASAAKQSQQQIYQQYLKAFKKGVFNYIKEDVDKYTKEAVPRKYFSGGFRKKDLALIVLRGGPILKKDFDRASLSGGPAAIDQVDIELQTNEGPKRRSIAGEADLIESISRDSNGAEDAMAIRQLAEDFAEVLNKGHIVESIQRDDKEGGTIEVDYGWDEVNHGWDEATYQVSEKVCPYLEKIIRSVFKGRLFSRRKKDSLRMLDDIKKDMDAFIAQQRAQGVVIKESFVKRHFVLPSSRGGDIKYHGDTSADPFLLSEGVKNLIKSIGQVTDGRRDAQTILNLMNDFSEKLNEGRRIESIELTGENNGAIEVDYDDNSIRPYTVSEQVYPPLAVLISGAFQGRWGFTRRTKDSLRILNYIKEAMKMLINQPGDAAMSIRTGPISRLYNSLRSQHDYPYKSNNEVKTATVKDDASIKDVNTLSTYFREQLRNSTEGLQTVVLQVQRGADIIVNIGVVYKKEGQDEVDLEKLADTLAMRAFNRRPHIAQNIDEETDYASVASNGGIDFNASNLNLQIKRDGRGVPLPLARQDMAQLSQIQGFVPEIIEIKPAFNVPIISELRQKLQASSV